MGKKTTTYRRCELVTNLVDKDGTSIFDLENMDNVLSERACIKEYAYVIHDKDVYTEADEKNNPQHRAGELKTPHVHCCMRFNAPQHPECVAKWFGIGNNFISKIHGSWEDALRYLIHLNAPEKHQYLVEEVKTNFDFGEAVKKYSEKKQLDDILRKILSGEIREYNKTTEIDQMMLVHYARQIEQAFKVRLQHLIATEANRNMECIFITGISGSGKTTLAKKIAKVHQYSYYISSGSNDVLDDYTQQECLILDELRPSCMGLSDLLKMTDNHTASSVKSRYKNKYLNCELMIITSVLDIDTFYRNVFSEADEPIQQLKRRCGIYIRMDKKTIFISQWDNKRMQYIEPIEYVNDICDEFAPAKELEQSDVENYIADLIPFIHSAEEGRESQGFTEVSDSPEIPFE